ncbi:hypothetical protein ALEA_19 [Pseudomonas phage ALEA]|uniref:Uncharacterized protein n=1 Tax=Pseudomonas phage AH05 TaxID=2869574 RepID=A0AAE7X1Z2_9CAUD|nr:hypothetical protein AH05_20 [Pseudomonas phage AH05]UAV89323.1 hypothetical protein ALEA_19 [Pseudomonas phage ALEA]UAV89422.1 hypothetical protein JOR_18 [Pseudomonas phage JOR]UAV89472.1 hypothetical protein M11_19 [Pseudomonas phage M1.1]UAV89521.1 hypothetical protein M12_18 [Pseudomonas phage M1.2]UAV89570.1 hypothetical protein M31_18 [Pseudomonas phage M3.1]UAV89793.1 hypothetical protein NOI_18 [Pseudomonas phage NOI]UAV90065.1 hypothetical protein SNK_19 [Pseudomonas phage SNK]
MNLAQGNTRSLPDGFLHVQNFTVTKASGMAGCVWAYLLTEDQKAAVEIALVERARVLEATAGPEWTGAAHHHKHGVWRFRKSFLKEHFKEVVHEATKLMQTPVVENFRKALIAEREALKV